MRVNIVTSSKDGDWENFTDLPVMPCVGDYISDDLEGNSWGQPAKVYKRIFHSPEHNGTREWSVSVWCEIEKDESWMDA